MQRAACAAYALLGDSPSMTDATARLSVADAAARLGVSTDTVRRKLKRGHLRATRDNHGQWWIELPADAAPAAPKQRAAYEPMQNAEAQLIAELRNQISRLGSDLDAAYAREIAERERHSAEVTRLEAALVAEAEAARNETDALRQDRDRWYQAAEAAQRQAEEALRQLAERRAGWLARLFRKAG